MKEYINLLMGLTAGLVLTFLNNSTVHESLNIIFTFFDPTNLEYIFISGFISKLIIILSFTGIFITITYSCLMLIKSLKYCLKK
ncbi:hypothetical protein H8923_01250 [Romboutsia hominis]|uniref:DUF4321 domain-containing protein n=1 Tax=Romboutsia faecis TaxID=2764597 RepID=A0ABR7JKE5_9FIRM|nr:hypothetical protein [Romboutsia faecis]MBC5995372.1 hypothetical protein [Romboutsia faecis]